MRLDDIDIVPGEELDRTFIWKERTLSGTTVVEQAVDFNAVAHTFTVRVAESGSSTDLGLSGITASSTDADGIVTVAFANAATDNLVAGKKYDVQVWATVDSSGLERGPAEFRINAKRRIGANL